ncbi:MAG: 50S ribosomal protein L9 [Oligoflexia bacterium]|nr:50S ribosomal protein L9 [Oligoflexia bacterium]
MKVILKEHVKNLGNVGDIVTVAAGHARNFLIPKKLAVLADDTNKKFIEDQKRRLLKKVNAQRDAAILLKQKIDGVVVELAKRVGGNGKLFGTVTSTELANELKNREIDVERKWIHTENPIKELGTFNVKVKIFADIESNFSVKVLMDPKQVEELKNKTSSKKKTREEQAKAAAAAAAAAAATTLGETSEDGVPFVNVTVATTEPEKVAAPEKGKGKGKGKEKDGKEKEASAEKENKKSEPKDKDKDKDKDKEKSGKSKKQ